MPDAHRAHEAVTRPNGSPWRMRSARNSAGKKFGGGAVRVVDSLRFGPGIEDPAPSAPAPVRAGKMSPCDSPDMFGAFLIGETDGLDHR